ncbi:MAG: glycosyltransferase family 2 protein [Hyphomonadaceae bacterium]|nr:glycosyltransferase family 2 protein [Hyphomonadaceae bacterium]
MRKVQPFFSVLIVNYNAGDLLQSAIDSLKNQTFKDFELVIVDNDSQDQSAEDLDTEGLPHVRVLRENQNHGFARGNNLAAQAANGKWLALLNPDATADDNWLEEIHAATERHDSCRVFACSQINMDEPELLDGAGDAYFAFGIPWRGGFEHPISELPSKDSHCFSPCGASAIYERDLFLEIGGFDERFFCYCEDIDLGIRLQLSGEKCVFLPEAVIHHKGSATSGRYSYFTMYHGFRNRTWAYIKNMPLAFLLLTLPGHLALMGYNYLNNLGNADVKGMREGMWDGLKKGWALRRNGDYRVRPTRKTIWNLMQSMSWNPARLSSRSVHVWAV